MSRLKLLLWLSCRRGCMWGVQCCVLVDTAWRLSACAACLGRSRWRGRGQAASPGRCAHNKQKQVPHCCTAVIHQVCVVLAPGTCLSPVPERVLGCLPGLAVARHARAQQGFFLASTGPTNGRMLLYSSRAKLSRSPTQFYRALGIWLPVCASLCAATVQAESYHHTTTPRLDCCAVCPLWPCPHPGFVRLLVCLWSAALAAWVLTPCLWLAVNHHTLKCTLVERACNLSSTAGIAASTASAPPLLLAVAAVGAAADAKSRLAASISIPMAAAAPHITYLSTLAVLSERFELIGCGLAGWGLDGWWGWALDAAKSRILCRAHGQC